MKVFLTTVLCFISLSLFCQSHNSPKTLISSCEEMRPLENFRTVNEGIQKFDLEETEARYGVPCAAGTIYYPVYMKRGTERLFFFVRHENPEYFSIKEILPQP